MGVLEWGGCGRMQFFNMWLSVGVRRGKVGGVNLGGVEFSNDPNSLVPSQPNPLNSIPANMITPHSMSAHFMDPIQLQYNP